MYFTFQRTFRYSVTFLLSFTIFGYIHKAEASPSTGYCILMCSKTFLLLSKWYCNRCAKNPPVDNVMCHFACKFTSLNPWALTEICEVCFQRQRIMMGFLCKDECVQINYDEENELCFACSHQQKNIATMNK